MNHVKKNAWLLKTEPDVFSVQDLADLPGATTHWDGVRNYQARNFMRDSMVLNDPVLIYHSNATPSSIVELAHVSRVAYPDFTAWDENDPHFDSKSNPQNPTWFMVNVTLESIFQVPLGLPSLRQTPGLEKMELLRKGSRLSVQPVRLTELKLILKLGKPQPI